MAYESNEIVRRARARTALGLAWRAIVRGLPELPILPIAPCNRIRWRRCRDVRFSVLGVGINFALALGTVVAFGYWRRIERSVQRALT